MLTLKRVSILTGLGLGVFVLSAFAAWNPPVKNPPDGNVDAPINVGDLLQTKIGPLKIGHQLIVNSDSITPSGTGLGVFGETELNGALKVLTSSGGAVAEFTDSKLTNSNPVNTWIQVKNNSNVLTSLGVLNDNTSYLFSNSNLALYSGNTERIRISGITGNVGIGTVAPVAKLDVVGKIKIVDGTQGTGKVLTSDANGLASWQTGGGSGGGAANAAYDSGWFQVQGDDLDYTKTHNLGTSAVVVAVYAADDLSGTNNKRVDNIDGAGNAWGIAGAQVKIVDANSVLIRTGSQGYCPSNIYVQTSCASWAGKYMRVVVLAAGGTATGGGGGGGGAVYYQTIERSNSFTADCPNTSTMVSGGCWCVDGSSGNDSSAYGGRPTANGWECMSTTGAGCSGGITSYARCVSSTPPPPLSVSCSPNINTTPVTSGPSSTVRWTAYATGAGGPGTYDYTWTGNRPPSTPQQTGNLNYYDVYYNSLDPNPRTMQVSVRSSGLGLTVNCDSGVTITP